MKKFFVNMGHTFMEILEEAKDPLYWLLAIFFMCIFILALLTTVKD